MGYNIGKLYALYTFVTRKLSTKAFVIWPNDCWRQYDLPGVTHNNSICLYWDRLVRLNKDAMPYLFFLLISAVAELIGITQGYVCPSLSVCICQCFVRQLLDMSVRHTHTHTHIYIYIYIICLSVNKCLCIWLSVSLHYLSACQSVSHYPPPLSTCVSIYLPNANQFSYYADCIY